MAPSDVIVVAETPSLGRSVLDLLEARGLKGHLVLDLPPALPPEWLGSRDPVVVVACNSPFCRTARRWSVGEFPGVRLVVVGSRDPILRTLPGVESLPLPLLPTALLNAVENLPHRPLDAFPSAVSRPA